MSFWTRRDGVAFALCFTAAFAVYVYSLPPSITLEDAGELAVAADYLGVPHPPGYPIWTFLAWFFQWTFHFVSFRGYPNPAWPIALMSAFFGAFACGIIAVCIRKLITKLPFTAQSPPPASAPILKAEVIGATGSLLLLSLLWASPLLGKALLLILGMAFVFLLILQSLSARDTPWKWLQTLPGPQLLGQGFWGALLALISWLISWYWIVVPTLKLLLPLSLSILFSILLLSAVIRFLFKKSLSKPHLEMDIQKSGMDLLMAVAGGLLLAFTPLMWSQSVIVEVYTLNAFFLSALLLLVLWYIHTPKDRTLYLAAFLFALGLTNHQSLLFLVFFLVAGVAAARNFALLKDGLFLMGLGALGFCLLKSHQYHKLNEFSARSFFLLLGIPVVLFLITLVMTRGGLFTRWRQLGCLLLLGILGLSFHLYMPLASEQNPPMNWGNARTLSGFKHSLTRGQYAKFSVADNFKQIGESLSSPPVPEVEGEINPDDLRRNYVKRTMFFRMLGTFFYDAHWKYSIANQFSWQISVGEDDPSGVQPPPPERQIPLAIIGLLPLLCFGCFPSASKGWFISSMVAMFFVTVVFLTIQWPELNHNDLWVKRVQYVQAHVLFAIWMAMGASILLFLLYSLCPKPATLAIPSVFVCGLFVGFPLLKDAKDPRHLEQLGSSNLHGHDYGWQYGFHQLKGANGILLDELAHHEDPNCRINDWAVSYLKDHGIPQSLIGKLQSKTAGRTLPLSSFRKEILKDLGGNGPDKLSKPQSRLIEQAATLAAFRDLSPEAQADALVYLHRPLPNWDYPPEMDQNAILFGGTDPGRFVPTYMIFSAEVRPDLYIITQTALADATYQITTRDLYGDEIFLPDLVDGNQAFLDYGNQLRLFEPEAFFQLMGDGNHLSISGVEEVNVINALLTQQMVERNRVGHSFYFEEALQMKWMIPYQRPHGLIFKIEPEPTELTLEDLQNDLEFWEWYEEHLLGNDKTKRNRYQRDLPVRKSFSKLRMAQAWNYYERGHWLEAERAMEQSLRLYPANPEAALRAGDMFIRMLKFDRAEEILNAFALHDPTNHQRHNFSVSLEKLRELDQLRKEYEEDYYLKPSGNLALNLMQIYGQLEMKKQELEMADVILNKNNLHVDFYIHLAAYMQREKNLTLYKKAVLKWAEKDPQDARPHIDLAVMALAENDYVGMAHHLVRAIQLDPERSRAQIAGDPRFVDIHHWEQFQRLISSPSRTQP
ncbi:DUF2723 domain-containing protein [Kiritimatiellaeota bacterium B1221]|nr:DUF2723 domain-containing protein [Kiritimatiellaeota bacterium B1221]